VRLEWLGWTLHRIWSTNWLAERDRAGKADSSVTPAALRPVVMVSMSLECANLFNCTLHCMLSNSPPGALPTTLTYLIQW
jgi:hypothetical protein